MGTLRVQCSSAESPEAMATPTEAFRCAQAPSRVRNIMSGDIVAPGAAATGDRVSEIAISLG
jgi:hypothetical protein